LVHGYHPDEPKVTSAAFLYPGHVLTNTNFRYPTFYPYFLGTLSIPVKFFFKIKAWSLDTYKIYVTIFGRFMSILLGLGSIFLTFVLANRLYNEKVGLLSALFLSLSLFHVQNSAWATLDVPNSFFFILTLYFAFKMYEDPTPKFYFLTGVSLGILVGTKYTGAIALIPILILHYYQNYQTHRERWEVIPNIVKSSLSKNLSILFLCAGVTFFLTTPGIILKPIGFVDSIFWELNLGGGRLYQSKSGLSLFFSMIKNFIRATGPFLSLFMILGLIYPFRRGWDKEIPLLATIILFFISFGALPARHLIAILPLTSILGAYAIFILYRKVHQRFIPKPIWFSLLTLWIIFAIAYNSAGILLRKDDTRTKAAYYIEENFPNGGTIGATSIGDYLRWSWQFPKIDTEKHKIIDALAKPKFIILTSSDYVRMERALESDKLHNYMWDPKYANEWHKAHIPSEEVFQFYDDILNEKGKKYKYRLIKKFEKNIFVPIEFPSPEIRIYERVED